MPRPTSKSRTRTSLAPGSAFSTTLLEFAVSTIELPRLTCLLDVGCGEMPYREMLSCGTYIGFDLSDTAYQEVRPDIHGDAQHLPVRSGAVDGVLCAEVIELVPDERQLVAELSRVLNPGGHLLITSPFVHGLIPEPEDYRRLTSLGLAKLLTASGFDVIEFVAVAGSEAVWMDGVARWIDSRLHAVLRRLAPQRWHKPVRHRFAGATFVPLANWLIARSSGGHSWRIDPTRPAPRLTLGYVVHAVRRGR